MATSAVAARGGWVHGSSAQAEAGPQVRTLGLVWALASEPTVHVEIDPAAAAELASAPEATASTAPADAQLEEWLAARLVEEGWAIGDARDASVELRLVRRDGAVWIVASAGGRVREVELDASGDAVGRLEMLHHAMLALEEVWVEPAANAPTEPVTTAPAAAPATAPATAVDHETPPGERTADAPRIRGPQPKLGGRIHARAGVIGRKRAIDAAVSLGIRGGRVIGPAFHLELGVWPSRPQRGLTIVEVTPALGFGWSFALGRRVELEPMLLAGVLLHAWRFDGFRRSRVDGSFEAPIELAIRVGRGVRVLVVTSVGIATQAREHIVANTRLWSRGAVRGGISLGLAWGAEPDR